MASFAHILSTSWCPYPITASFKPEPLPASASPLDVFDDYYHVDDSIPSPEPTRPSLRFSHAVRVQQNPEPPAPRRRPASRWFTEQLSVRDRIRPTVASVERESKSNVVTRTLDRMNRSSGLIFCDNCLLDKPSPLFVLVGCSHALCEHCAGTTGFDIHLPRPASSPGPSLLHLTCLRCKRNSAVVTMQQHRDKPQTEPEQKPKAPETATIPKRRFGITHGGFMLSPGRIGHNAPQTPPESNSDDDYEII